ncbi:hypothetical protein Y032_0182g897 [Ancylostoma ceylanicum]|uniref:E3 ubiquitin-protein ligase PPP1R11 n=1 Tax=Ancylostoma ceylanicum TaxID=53326 RepID=A0A016SSR5_9BILA|nr:hypothetical protein Y032_0182g897 [Ancylostoma ceylanicum]
MEASATVLATEVITEERQNEKKCSHWVNISYDSKTSKEDRKETWKTGVNHKLEQVCYQFSIDLLNVKEDLVLRLRSAPADDGPHVTWAPDVIDNEHLGRLKSNCCCIYTRPRVWNDPSTWEQDEAETEHCRGHTLPPPRKPDDNSENPKDCNEGKQ